MTSTKAGQMSLQIEILIAAFVAILTAMVWAHAFARMGFPLPPDSGRFGYIDGLRGFLALSVMVHHFRLWTLAKYYGLGWGTGPSPLNNFGAGAVSMFFAITGLVFYKRVAQGSLKTDWTGLFISRILRILPAVILSIGIISFIIILRSGIRGSVWDNLRALLLWASAWQQPALFGYADSGRLNAYVFWSLRVEWLFYFLLLPFLAIARDFTRPFLPSWTIPAGLMVASLFIHFFVPSLSYWPRFGLLFAAGMLAFEIRQRIQPDKLAGGNVGLLATAALIIAASHYPSPYIFPANLLYMTFFIVVTCGNSIFGILASRAAKVLGEISFSIYILHGIILDVVFTNILRSGTKPPSVELIIISILLSTSLVVLASLASYLLVEAPGIRLGRMILSARNRKHPVIN